MNDQEPSDLSTFGDEVSRMLHARALRHPDHTDPVGITRRHLHTARTRQRTVVGAAATLVVTTGAVVGGYAGYAHTGAAKGAATAKTTSAAPDYTAKPNCADSAKFPVDILRGATPTQIGNALASSDIVKSVKAYTEAAERNHASAQITPGTYVICPHISASAALQELLKKSNLSQASQIIVEPHESAKDVIASLIDKRKWRQADFDAAISDNTIGLPAWSVNSTTHQFTVEGMLEPGTYSLTSADTPQSVLKQMVADRMAFLTSIDFEAKATATACGPAKCTPEQVLTVASIAEAEVTEPADGAKVAEAVYQRLKNDDYLGLDSTSLYAIGHLPGGQPPTRAQITDPGNPYSTYPPHHGLPPTPIAVMDDAMIKAVLAPTDAGYYSWCVTPGDTLFFKKSQQAARDKMCGNTVHH